MFPSGSMNYAEKKTKIIESNFTIRKVSKLRLLYCSRTSPPQKKTLLYKLKLTYFMFTLSSLMLDKYEYI